MSWLHSLYESRGYVRTDGAHYGPYNALRILWKGERFAVVHCKGHKQYWGQNEHYIPANVMVFEKKDTDSKGDWLVEKVKEEETGRASRKVQAEMIEWAKAKDRED